jgi:hypothetical protein
MNIKTSQHSVDETVARPRELLDAHEDGETTLAYTKPAELAARYGLADELAAPLAAIDGLTDTLIEQ